MLLYFVDLCPESFLLLFIKVERQIINVLNYYFLNATQSNSEKASGTPVTELHNDEDIE